MRKQRIALPEIRQDLRNYYNALHALGMEPIAITDTAGTAELQAEAMRQAARESTEKGISEGLTASDYIPEFLDYSRFCVEDYDGLVLPGGGDIDPKRYGQRNQGMCKGIHEDLDELQFLVFDSFIKAKKPVFGTCRGQQLINVYFGGTLIQHLPTFERHVRPADSKIDKVHGCRAEKGSWIELLYGSEFFHNSAHHQAADRLGDGLVIDSHCTEDGVAESLHHRELPIYAVQWHPERMCLKYERTDTVNGLEVFRFFQNIVESSRNAG